MDIPRVAKVFTALSGIVSPGTSPYDSIAIGYNSCLDLIVPALPLLESMGITSPPEGQYFPTGGIMSKEQFAFTFKYSFEHGSAIERFIEDETLCKEIISSALELEDKVFFTGGNAALMGRTFSDHGIRVLLGGAVGDETKKLLPSLFQFANSEGHDEIHLIMEFSRGQKWGSLTSPRANRVIVHCDYSNSRVAVLEDFHEAIENKQDHIDLVVITGLHLLERENPDYRTKRIATVVNRIQLLKPQITLHFELASIADLSFLSELANSIFPFVDSLGLNEQELGFLYYSVQGSTYEDKEIEDKIKKDYKDPSIDTIINTLGYIFEYSAKLKSNNRFSRIHFHSLKFHIVAQLKGRWDSGRVSVAAGSFRASVQSCEWDKKKT